jgi:flagellar biosynthetic protein FlhB
MAEQEEGRTLAASPHKLREAQKRGQVAKSTEANFAAIMAAVVGVCFAMGPSIARRELMIAQNTLNHADSMDWSSESVAHWLLQITASSFQALAPLLLAIVCVAIVANVAQVGGVFSFDPIKPDFNRINPATGLQKLFSLRALYDALRSVLKLALLSCVAWIALKHLMPDLLKLNYIDAHDHATLVLGDVSPLLFKLLLAILLIALLDIIYTRTEFAKKMRMSHREMTDEHKQREGDPRIRRRLRQLRSELLKQARAVQKLPEADVLITNPTHIAVALSYRHGEMPAPKLLAKGSGILAAKMRATARRHHIPVVENPPLARELFKQTDLDQYVPEELYPKVAKILIWVYAMRKNRARNPQANPAWAGAGVGARVRAQ